MKQRIITAVVAIAIFIPFLIFSDTPAFTVCFLILSLIASYEMLGCLGLRKSIPVSALTYVFTGLTIVMTRVLKLSYFMMYLVFATLIFVLMLMLASLFSKGRIQIDNASEVFMMIFYIVVTFSCIILTRDAENGAYLYLLIFISAWVTDSGAYFTGVFFGKHKLIPDVSPKKTIEGAVGGIIICTAVTVLYAFAISLITELRPNYIIFAAGGAVLSVASMIGDLQASLVKRRHKIKDYGFVFPGHGGVLDRFDSVLTTAPLLMMLATLTELYK